MNDSRRLKCDSMIGGSELQKDFLRLQPHFRDETHPNR